ncbi:MAG TPA: L-threonylcarbamoyladenylate synthase [Novosphingobium sp.]|nr:L-threonylcarbamoyladenylate synthase [Novosphingobium sp.]
MTGNSKPQIVQADAAGIALAVRLLTEGRLVAVPTETVYGLAARADSAQAVAGIYRAKGRPDFNPLIVHVRDLTQAGTLARFDARARRLAERFWPGPLTMVLPRRDGAALAGAVTAGLETLALRCPAHPAMRGLLSASGLPLAAPSANRSGAVSPTRAEHVAASLGAAIDCIVDGGPCETGIESTIVGIYENGWRLLRPGPVTGEEIAECLGEPETRSSEEGRISAPGQLASHYSPGKPVRLNAMEAAPDEFLIGFGEVHGDFALSPSGDPIEASARLYDALHAAAASVQPRIAVAPVPEDGVGAAINDRLKRAAA